MLRFFTRLTLAVALALVLPVAYADATTLFDGIVNQNATCGGDCFGLTYELIITDAGDANPNTYTGQIKITGNSTTTFGFIASVDFKPDANSITSASLTSAPGGIGGWSTAINLGQASGDCASSGVGFICSNDTGNNSLAPTGNNLNYSWAWDFSMTGSVDPGHLGVRFNDETDSGNGQIVSAASFDSGGCTGPNCFPTVPEPSALILFGTGLVFGSLVIKRISGSKT